MQIKSILNDWGVIVPDDAYIAELLLESRPKQCYYMDALPLTVDRKNAEKFYQVEMFFQRVLEGEVLKEDFLLLEMKYRKVMIKLWLYNELIIEYTFPEREIKNIPQIIDKPYLKRFKELHSQYVDTSSIIIKEKMDLELFIQSAMRDVLCTTYFLKEYELIIIPSWSCFVVYFNDINKFQTVKDIAFSEGLFLRPCNKTVSM